MRMQQQGLFFDLFLFCAVAYRPATRARNRGLQEKTMHYFKRNIGDYHKKAGRLSMLEHGAYTLLIDACYDRERFPTKQEAIDWCWARTPEEMAAVEFVLYKFFHEVDGVYQQTRIQEEIDKYHENSNTNARIAREREEQRRTNRERTVNEPPPNHKPITNNHKPSKTPSAVNAIAFDGTTWLNTDKHFLLWQKAYPAIDLKTELSKAAAWLIANPKNTKSNYARFLTNWFTRAQDRAPTTNSPPAKMNNADKYLNSWDVKQPEQRNERDITAIAERVG